MEVHDNAERSRYEIVIDDGVAGFISYRAADGVVAMVHAEVSPELEGQGVGSALAQGALDDVRRRGLLVRPRCPFVAAYIERHPDYADLVAP